MTGWSEIICDYAMLFINDDRTTDKLRNNPARFFREMSLYVRSAIPRFNRPPEIIPWLKRGTEPKFDSYLWTVPEPEAPLAGSIPVSTGMTGYELCSVVVRGTDRYGNTIETPYTQVRYDPETGEVYFSEELDPGTVFDLDFYTDGYFENELTQEMKRLLGLCVQLVWENRFASAWLPREAKVADRSFTTPNEANWTRAQEEKRRSLEATLNEELRLYEHNCAYMSTVGVRRNTLL